MNVGKHDINRQLNIVECSKQFNINVNIDKHELMFIKGSLIYKVCENTMSKFVIIKKLMSFSILFGSEWLEGSRLP